MERSPVTAYVALGANLGDAQRTVRQALSDLALLPHTTVLGRSSLYATAPVQASGPDYVNAVAAIETRLSAPGLLRELQALERRAGRRRGERNAPRTLDLDLLLYGSARIDSERLVVPHPRMGGRAFVLVPLAEVSPQSVQPGQLQAVAGQVVRRIGPA